MYKNSIKDPTKEEIESIKKLLIEKYKNEATELTYKNPYELLVAIILSAQCTDKRVNIVTPALFKKYPTILKLSVANINELKDIIKSCSFFNNKAKNLISMANRVVKEHQSSIPLKKDELLKLAGVGNKTANVFLIEHKRENLMAVDTHVFRVSHRLSLSRGKTAIKTEQDITKKFKDNLNILHHAMVLFGRYICTAKKPKCKDKCFLSKYCKSKERFKLS